ncbi:MAG: hypothetical protein Q8O93_01890 [bacterium]|nr:hypothetical protein [bacterium]
MADDKKKGSLDDATNVIVNEVMPPAVKWLLDKVPEDQYEKIFQEKRLYWNMVLPFFSFALLRATNSPKIVDDLTTEFFAEVRREVNRRAGGTQSEESGKNDEKSKPQSSGESFATSYLKAEVGSRKILAKRLSQLDEDDKVAFFKISLPQKDAQQIINNLIACEEAEFSELISLLIPKKKQKAEPTKRVDIIAEMAKHPELLKRFTELEKKEQKELLAHLERIPNNQLADHLQTIKKMDNPSFLLYIKTLTNIEQERIWPQIKKIGEGLQKSFRESFKKWRKEDKKKQTFSSAFKAGMNSGGEKR